MVALKLAVSPCLYAFGKSEHQLSELEEMGYNRSDILLDPTGGTTPMRVIKSERC